MTKFNPENKKVLTYGEALSPAMSITDQKDADQYFEDYVKYTQKYLDEKPDEDGKTAEEIVRINLGYYAGYCSDDTRKRIEKLFNCSHPIFGKIEEAGSPTAKEAYEAGIRKAKES